jgi:hypothetical protein
MHARKGEMTSVAFSVYVDVFTSHKCIASLYTNDAEQKPQTFVYSSILLLPNVLCNIKSLQIYLDHHLGLGLDFQT